jgi:hypothetical protein
MTSSGGGLEPVEVNNLSFRSEKLEGLENRETFYDSEPKSLQSATYQLHRVPRLKQNKHASTLSPKTPLINPLTRPRA